MDVAKKTADVLVGGPQTWVVHFVWLLPLIAGCSPQSSNGQSEGFPSVNAVPVHVAKVTLTSLRPSIDLVGTLVVIPEHTAFISSQIGGYVESVAVIEGDVVHAGDVVVHLDTRIVEARLARASGLVKEKQAVLARLTRGYLPQEVEMARHSEHQARVRSETLRAKLKAMETLRDKEEVSVVEYQKIRSSSRVADAVYGEAHAKLELLEAGTPIESIAQAEAQLAIARAELTAARLDISFCDVVASIDGIVTMLSVRRGMSVTPADQLGFVVDHAGFLMQIRIPSVYLNKIRKGARADVYFRSFPERTFKGKVDRLSAQADTSSGDMDAFVLVHDETDDLLRPGLAGHARIWLPVVENALTVPVAAVADRNGVPIVTVVRDGQAFEIDVAVGEETENTVQIAHGLSAGDTVITEGGYGLPEGCPVRPTTDTAPGEQ